MEDQSDYKEKYLIVPIIQYIDDPMRIISNAEHHFTSRIPMDIDKTNRIVRERASLINIRIIASHDDLLTDANKAFISDNYTLLDHLIANDSGEGEIANINKNTLLKASIILDRLMPKLIKK